MPTTVRYARFETGCSRNQIRWCSSSREMLPGEKKSWLTSKRISRLWCMSDTTLYSGKSLHSGLSEASHLVLFYHQQSWHSSCMLHGWSAGCYHATEGGSLCWQHHSRSWELSCSSVCSFSCANKQLSTSSLHSASSGSPHVQHLSSHTSVSFSSFTHIISTKSKKHNHSSDWYTMTNATIGLTLESRKSPFIMVARVQCQCQISSYWR